MSTDGFQLAHADRAFVVAPAGCGKTELIAQALVEGNGRSLVLTHTHAGVNALRTRFARYGLDRDRFEVQTIAGWSLRYAASFPQLSGLTNPQPSGPGWEAVYQAMHQLLASEAVRRIIQNSYSGIYVDEYQDCSLAQHKLILALASLLPCRVLGDPLQAIFDFRQPTVSWVHDVAPNFQRLPDLNIPYRWLGKNQTLGQWLLEQRSRLVAGEVVDLSTAPVRWLEASDANRVAACRAVSANRDQQVVALGKWPDFCHKFASRMSGLYTSMEELDCKDLVQFADEVDRADNAYDRVLALLRVSYKCFTVLSSKLRATERSYEQRRPAAAVAGAKNFGIVLALNRVVEQGSSSLLQAARLLERYEGAVRYRRELWSEVKTTIRTFEAGGRDSMAGTAWFVRDRARRGGRKPEHRVVSRTLLVKGLEFDHAVVLDVDPARARDRLNAKEFYVAASRGSRSLTVLSAGPTLSFAPVENVLPEML